ncbi:MAG TPA: amidohydrolase family protein [Pseudonocardia sp.]|uniref:amidohydrolase family protein n=1 Tax=Pseudonocardia sp. TaxID=60912 RepID=UPI002C33FD6A|nr:amidohydrolase family protein [Pseudonocardia sp.]HTF46718.1 amidohydrolase family protein [Pseudonocardia sp.]
MPFQRIDVHTHGMSDQAVAAVAGRGYEPTGGYRISVRWTAQAALAYMDRQQIAAQLVSMPISFAGSDDDPDFGTNVSRMINEGHAELIATHPGRFGAFATLPADGPEQALEELAYALDELRLDGVVLTSNVRGRYLGDPSLEPVLAELERREVPVFVHPEDCPHIEVLGFGRPSSIVEFPFDTARTVTNALYTGVFQRYPRLRLILAHCGGALPTLGWRIAEHTVMGRGPHDADIDPEHVAQVLRGLYYETALAGSRNSLLPTLELTTADHILFGTDWPAAPEPTVERNTSNLTSFDGFTKDELRGVERANALKLFPRLG